MTNILNHEQVLWLGEKLISENNAFELILQQDGNLVLYRIKDKKVFFASNTVNKEVDAVRFQNDGNLVVYKKGGKNAAWASNTEGKGGTVLKLENNGDLVIQDGSGKIIWQPSWYFTNSWISNRIDPKKLISEVNIPGTHDTGALSGFGQILADIDNTSVGRLVLPDFTKKGSANCQDFDVPGQLSNGIRFLDIRLSSMENISKRLNSHGIYDSYKSSFLNYGNNDLLLVHGEIIYKTTFDTVLNGCKAFLKENKDEFIVMSVKPDGVGFDESIWKSKYDNDPVFYNGCQYPTVEQASGKIVLLRRFNSPNNLNGFYFNVENDTTDQKSNVKVNCTTPYEYVTQDKYSIKLSNCEDKKKEIIAMINNYKSSKKDLLLVNFASFEGKDSGFSTLWTEVPYPKNASEKINPWLRDELRKNGKNKYGIIPMDFPTQDLINTIIESN